MATVVRVATRASALARWQAENIAAQLPVECELMFVSTEGDRRTDVPLHEIGGRGVFVKDVQRAVLDGDADIAVHSAKDLPSEVTAGLRIAAVPVRGDARDALVGASLDDIPTGGHVATGSVRRRAQLAALRTDLVFAPLRGNIGTRLDKAENFDAIVVAAAALDRLGLSDRIAQALDPATMLPQVGQGALAVECRADDRAVGELLATIQHEPSRRAVDAERAFLAEIGGGCDVPCAAHATESGAGLLKLDALLASLDGHIVLRAHCEGEDPLTVGRDAAIRILDGAGARSVLETLT